MTCGIYAIVHLDSMKAYIGRNVNVQHRLDQHVGMLNRDSHHNLHLLYAWQKYNENAFVFTLLEECSKDKCVEREDWWMNQWPQIYNIGSAERGGTTSEVARRAVASALKRGTHPSQTSTYEQRCAYRKKGIETQNKNHTHNSYLLTHEQLSKRGKKGATTRNFLRNCRRICDLIEQTQSLGGG